MAIEGDHHGLQPAGIGQRVDGADDPTVPDVDAVERSDGDRGAGRRTGERRVVVEDLHDEGERYCSEGATPDV